MPTQRSTPQRTSGGTPRPGDPGGSGVPGGGPRESRESRKSRESRESGATGHAGGAPSRGGRSPASRASAAAPGGSGPVTLQRIADEAGVSLATASRVLNGSTRTVNPELAEHVRAVAARLRYVSHGPAQALARATTSLVGLLVHDVNDPYFSAIAAGAMGVARENDLLVMVANTHREPGLELDYITRLGAQRARAILVAGSPSTDPERSAALTTRLREYAAGGGRVVSIGDQGPDIDAVVPDNTAGAREAGLHLAGLGHSKVGVVNGPAGLVTVVDRLGGFRAGLADGLAASLEGGAKAPGSVVTAEADFTRDSGYTATQRLLEAHPDVTAILALNDLMALGVLAALRDAGLRVPEDVSVVGFDDLPIAADVTPALTTVRLELETMGAQAMGLVVDQEDGPGPRDRAAGPRERRVVPSPTSLVVRASTAPVRR